MSTTPFIVKCINPTIRTTKNVLYIASEQGSKGFLIRCDTGASVWLGRNRFEVIGEKPEATQEPSSGEDLVNALKVLIAHNAQINWDEQITLFEEGVVYYDGTYYYESDYTELFAKIVVDTKECERLQISEKIKEVEKTLSQLNTQYSKLS